MIKSARSVSIFSRYTTGLNDMHCRVWSRRLLSSAHGSEQVTLRPCVPVSANSGQFLTEHELIARVLEGDALAMEWFSNQCRRLVREMLRNSTVDVLNADSVMQAVMQQLSERDGYRLRQWCTTGRCRLSTYVRSVIKRILFDWTVTISPQPRGRVRPQGNGTQYAQKSNVWSQDFVKIYTGAVGAGLTDLQIARDQKRAVRHTVSRLLHRDSEILRRRFFSKQSQAEIALAMSMSVPGVERSLLRVESRIRGLLAFSYPGLFD